jgi:hypothetical protein
VISSLGEALGNLISKELIAEINQLSIDPPVEIDDYDEEFNFISRTRTRF